MERRELLKMISLATGCALIGGPALLTGCSSAGDYSGDAFSATDVALLAAVAETIVPRTQTPGATDANVAPFIAMMVDDCYSDNDQAAFHAGLLSLRQTSAQRHGAEFSALEAAQQTALLTELDREARSYQRPEGGSAHYFTMIKQLTLLGYFTSEIAQTQLLRHVPIPGRYDGCYPYQEGDTAWAI